MKTNLIFLLVILQFKVAAQNEFFPKGKRIFDMYIVSDSVNLLKSYLDNNESSKKHWKMEGGDVFEMITSKQLICKDKATMFCYGDGVYVELFGFKPSFFLASKNIEKYKELSNSIYYRSDSEKVWRNSLGLTPMKLYRALKDTIRYFELNPYALDDFSILPSFVLVDVFTKDKIEKNGVISWYEEGTGFYSINGVTQLHELYILHRTGDQFREDVVKLDKATLLPLEYAYLNEQNCEKVYYVVSN